MNEPVGPIQPEVLAAKIAGVQNYRQPRLLEEFGSDPRLLRVLWFLQWVSRPENYPGGLNKFAADLIESERDQIGTTESAKLARHTEYTAREAISILRQLPDFARGELLEPNEWLFDKFYYMASGKTFHQDALRALPQIVTPGAVHNLCVEGARRGLAQYLRDLCELPHVGIRPAAEHETGAPWYFMNVADALLAFIQKRKQSLLGTMAETEVTRLVTRWIEKSRNTRRPVMIIGNSRFGKSESVKLNASIDPGSCRFVETPRGNALGDLLLEVAKSLGMEVGPRNSGRDLRERIDYILGFSRLQLIFDEAHLLLPGTYSRTTEPARLNWVRRAIMDQGTPAVFVCTRQSYFPAKNRFVKKTGFAMEQFDERILKTVHLPKELPESELLGVAQIHFPRLAAEYLRYVVDKVSATERNFVSDIEKIATLAKDNAREQGRKLPILADIKAAIADVLPATPEGPAVSAKDQPERRTVLAQKPVRRPRKGALTTRQPLPENGRQEPRLDICSRPNPPFFRREMQTVTAIT